MGGNRGEMKADVRFRLMESMKWLDDAVDLVACLRHDYLQYAEGNATLPRH
jgi:hypothetical protein